MQILLVNDDGIHAPGLKALARELKQLGDVQVVAPLIEQSGVSHRITYRHPLMVHEMFDEAGEHEGWAVDGSPADCTKMGILEFCPRRPDLIVSGINSGANVGINVLYSGTVAAAIEGAFFGITSIAVSLQQGTPPDYPAAAKRAVTLIPQLQEAAPASGMLWNINFPNSSKEGPLGVKVCRMGVRRHSDTIERRLDPRGKPYYWSGLDPIKSHEVDAGSDVTEIQNGYVTLTPLRFDLTRETLVDELQATPFRV
ncbi:MAG: 5'/3'-nucleotidase SurE [Planctomycetaceae bacterium]